MTTVPTIPIGPFEHVSMHDTPSLQIADPPTFDSAQDPLMGVSVGVTTLIGTTRYTSS